MPLTPPPSRCVQVSSSSCSPLRSPMSPHIGPSWASQIRPHLLTAAPCATSSSAQPRLTPILRVERGWGKPSCRDRSLNSQNWEPVCQTRRFFTSTFIHSKIRCCTETIATHRWWRWSRDLTPSPVQPGCEAGQVADLSTASGLKYPEETPSRRHWHATLSDLRASDIRQLM